MGPTGKSAGGHPVETADGWRVWEIDCLRGLAVCMMLVANLTFDLDYFVFSIDPQSGFLPLFARGTAGLFVFLVGLSLTLSDARAARSGRRRFGRFLRRGLRIFGLGLLVSAATRLAVRDDFVVFGVLHLIGTAIVLAYPFLTLPAWVSLVTGLLIMGLGPFLAGVTVDFPWLLWLGVPYQGFSSVDYVPLVPWFGPVLVGIFAGRTLYPEGRRRWRPPDGWTKRRTLAPLAFCGRHSLLIYFVHQPVFLGLIILAARFSVL